MNMKHLKENFLFLFLFFFFLFAFFKEALEVGMDLHILVQRTFIVSFSSNEAMRFQKKKNADFKKIPEIGPKL